MSREESQSYSTRSKGAPVDASFLDGGGEMGALIRSIDWSKTPLGHVSGWPQSLRTSISICLSSRFPILLWWGPELVMLYNDAYRPMTGAKHPWSMGRPGLEVWTEIRDVIGPMLHGVMTTGEATWSEDLMLPLVRRDVPEESYFTFTYSPIRDETGGIGGVFCAVVETTEKVIEERRLRLLNALADATQAKTPAEACKQAAEQVAKFTSDVPFALLYLLDEAGIARLAGAANIEPGQGLAPLTIAPGDDAAWSAVYAPRFAELRDAPSGVRLAVILPIERSDERRPFGFMVAALSPLLSRSASYDRFHNLLVTSVSQAVNNAANYEQERRRAEALAEIDRAKTTFFSNISHEFRTPLTLMLAPIQDMLAAPPGAAMERSSVEVLHRNALRLLKLVNTLLEFSRIEAGRVEAVYQPVDLPVVTAELASTFRAAIERGGLSFIVDCAPMVEPVYVDVDMWEKIVLNLLSNAFKFTFVGSITVRLRADDRSVRLDVGDTGTGIPADEVPRLFERFHRIAGARSRSHEGSGIGLALIHELVRLHGGEVAVSSQVGAGTTFSVTLPRGFSHLPAARVRAQRTLVPTTLGASVFVGEALRWGLTDEGPWPSSESPSPVAGETNRERILYAEDNADMREYVTRLLSERWTVEAVSDGLTALASIRRSPPSLILCDVMMPGLDGFGLVKALRAEDETRGIPVIILSARAGAEETQRGLESGANDYIAKPFSARELLVRVASSLTAARVGRERQEIEASQRAHLYRHFMQAPFPIAVFKGSRHRVELANPRILQAWGKTDIILGQPLEEALPELRGQPFLDWLDGVFQTGVAYEGKDQLARLPTGPDGALQDTYYNFVYAPLRDASGVVEGILLSAFDVTAQLLARKASDRENRFERSARRAAEVGAAVGSALVSTKPLSDQLRLCCDALVTMGATFARVWKYDSSKEVLDLRASQGTYTHQDAVKTLDLRAHIDAASAHTLPPGALKLRKVVASRASTFSNDVIRDPEITDREWASREGIVAFAGFPLLIGERIVGVLALFAKRELTEGDLGALASAADQIALGIDRDESERFRELFIGMLGHDLRNPLNAVNMATHLLASRLPNSEQRTLARIQSSTSRMERMISQVLDFTRARAGGGIPVTRTPTDLAVVCSQVVEELSVANPDRHLRMTCTGEAEGLWDADRLGQVFSNLTSNALAHGSRDGPVVVRLDCTANEARYSVHNVGAPIPAELMPNLFDPFRRARHAKLAGTHGLGLGLFISSEIVKAHGGEIHVASTAEGGTVFEVILPKVAS